MGSETGSETGICMSAGVRKALRSECRDHRGSRSGECRASRKEPRSPKVERGARCPRAAAPTPPLSSEGSSLPSWSCQLSALLAAGGTPWCPARCPLVKTRKEVESVRSILLTLRQCSALLASDHPLPPSWPPQPRGGPVTVFV